MPAILEVKTGAAGTPELDRLLCSGQSLPEGKTEGGRSWDRDRDLHIKRAVRPVTVVQAFSPSTQDGRQRHVNLCKFKASLGSTVS